MPISRFLAMNSSRSDVVPQETVATFLAGRSPASAEHSPFSAALSYPDHSLLCEYWLPWSDRLPQFAPPGTLFAIVTT
jgi:hypothetical protein